MAIKTFPMQCDTILIYLYQKSIMETLLFYPAQFGRKSTLTTYSISLPTKDFVFSDG